MMLEETSVDRAERLLIEGILGGTYPPGDFLPGERTLSKNLELARPALREALQRLSQDGWLDIQQGKPTRVRDFMRFGKITILPGLLRADPDLLPGLIVDLLEMWGLFAASYTEAAVKRAPGLVIDQLDGCLSAEDTGAATVQMMWSLHRTLIDYCGNQVYGLIFNTFDDFYHQLALYYYSSEENRAEVRTFWLTMRGFVEAGEARKAARLMAISVHSTREYWASGEAVRYQEGIEERGAENDE